MLDVSDGFGCLVPGSLIYPTNIVVSYGCFVWLFNGWIQIIPYVSLFRRVFLDVYLDSHFRRHAIFESKNCARPMDSPPQWSQLTVVLTYELWSILMVNNH